MPQGYSSRTVCIVVLVVEDGSKHGGAGQA